MMGRLRIHSAIGRVNLMGRLRVHSVIGRANLDGSAEDSLSHWPSELDGPAEGSLRHWLNELLGPANGRVNWAAHRPGELVRPLEKSITSSDLVGLITLAREFATGRSPCGKLK